MGREVALVACLLVFATSALAQFLTTPSPKIVLVGPTGSGKSSLANALLGCDPRENDCMFEVCNSIDSCSKETQIGTGKWLGKAQNFTIVDTPGFGDSDNEDEILIQEMMDVLVNKLGQADTLALVIKGSETRFTAGLQKMLNRLTIMFGPGWWDYLVFVVSFWPYDQDSIDDRECFPDFPQFCKDEAWFASEFNRLTQEKFDVDKDFTFIFADSWSQAEGPPGFNTDDILQQEHWQEETDMLWEITSTRTESFEFIPITN